VLLLQGALERSDVSTLTQFQLQFVCARALAQAGEHAYAHAHGN
jgi:hypothetical protein